LPIFSADGSFTVVHDAHTIVRLGENLVHTGRIGEPAIQRAITCLEEYDRICTEATVDLRVGVATSAVRFAANGGEVLQRLRTAFSGSLQCIGGLEEAELTFSGSVPDQGSYVVLDIGGGSTEIVYGTDGVCSDRSSIELGAVVLHERFLCSFPPNAASVSDACRFIADTLSIREHPDQVPWIGVAGTPTTLALMSLDVHHSQVGHAQGHVLGIGVIDDLVMRLLSATREELLAMSGIHPGRADILPAGALILREVMMAHGCDRLTVDTHGLRYGVAKRAFAAASRRR
ncbi:MAG: hypothetical protein ACKOBV_08090, partial [Candidatus Kapaibacterium sp.]